MDLAGDYDITSKPNLKKNTMKEEGKRYNEGKLRYDLVHPFAFEGMVKVLTHGATKYDERNWEKAMRWTKVIASLKRHLAEIEKGNDFDDETGLLHIDHVQCNAHFLSAYYKIAPQFDDRPHSYLQQPKISLDVDELVCDWLGGWIEQFGMDVPENWFFDRKIQKRFKKLKKKGKLDDFYLSLKPLINPSDIPFEPHCYVTSRPVKTKITEKWLDDNGFPARPVYSVGVGESKVEVLKKAGAQWHIDDRFENFTEVNNAGICGFLMDRPHNRRYNVGFKRIKSLKDLVW